MHYSDEHLIGALDGRRAAHPDLVALELRGDEGDDLLEVDSLSRLEVALELGGERWLQHQPQLLAQLARLKPAADMSLLCAGDRFHLYLSRHA